MSKSLYLAGRDCDGVAAKCVEVAGVVLGELVGDLAGHDDLKNPVNQAQVKRGE